MRRGYSEDKKDDGGMVKVDKEVSTEMGGLVRWEGKFFQVDMWRMGGG